MWVLSVEDGPVSISINCYSDIMVMEIYEEYNRIIYIIKLI